MPTLDPTWATDVVRGGCGVAGCVEPTCVTQYGECHCGCRQPTTVAKQSSRKLNLVKSEPQRYIVGHGGVVGREHRWANTAAERAARERVCAHDGCSESFTPTPGQLRLGKGKYCSAECYWAALRKYPVKEARVCERRGCNNIFTPHASAAGDPRRGLYCSRFCADLAKATRIGKKVTLRCDQCGRDRHVRRYYAEKGQRFCSQECWGEFRKRHNLAGFKQFLFGPLVSGTTRKAYGQMWGGNTPAKDRPRGRPRGTYSERVRNHESEILLRRARGESIGKIAVYTGLSKSTIWEILSRGREAARKAE